MSINLIESLPSINGVVYILYNTKNGKRYVGQTIQSFPTRWRKHKSHAKTHQTHLARAIRKHGAESFVHQILISDIETQAELDNCEKVIINLFNSGSPEFGYNETKGGQGFCGKHSPTTILKMRHKLIGRVLSDSHKINIGKASALRWADPTYKTRVTASIRKTRIYTNLSEEHKKKISVSHLGKKLSEQHKNNIGNAHVGMPSYWKGKSLPEETKEKMRVSHRLRWAKKKAEQRD